MDSVALSDAVLTENGTMTKNNASSSQKKVNAESTTKLPKTQDPKALQRSKLDAHLASLTKEGLSGLKPSDVVRVCLTFLDKLLSETLSNDIISLTHTWTMNDLKAQGFDEETAKRILAVILLRHEVLRNRNPMRQMFDG